MSKITTTLGQLPVGAVFTLADPIADEGETLGFKYVVLQGKHGGPGAHPVDGRQDVGGYIDHCTPISAWHFAPRTSWGGETEVIVEVGE